MQLPRLDFALSGLRQKLLILILYTSLLYLNPLSKKFCHSNAAQIIRLFPIKIFLALKSRFDLSKPKNKSLPNFPRFKVIKNSFLGKKQNSKNYLTVRCISQ